MKKCDFLINCQLFDKSLTEKVDESLKIDFFVENMENKEERQMLNIITKWSFWVVSGRFFKKTAVLKTLKSLGILGDGRFSRFILPLRFFVVVVVVVYNSSSMRIREEKLKKTTETTVGQKGNDFNEYGIL